MAKKDKKVKIYHVNEEMRGKTIGLPDIGDVTIGADGSVEVDMELAKLLTTASPSWSMDEQEVEVMDNEDGEIKDEELDPELEDDELGEEEEVEETEEAEEEETEAESNDTDEDEEEDEEPKDEPGEFPRITLHRNFSLAEMKTFCEEQQLKGFEKIRSKDSMLKFLEENWHDVSDDAKKTIDDLK